MTKRTVEYDREYTVQIFSTGWQSYASHLESMKEAREWRRMALDDGFKVRIRIRETIVKERVVK